MIREFSSIFDFAFRALDVLVLIVVTNFLESMIPELMPEQLYRSVFVYGLALVVVVFPLFDLYRSWRGMSLLKESKFVFGAWITVLVVFNIFILILANPEQREVLVPYCLFGIHGFIIWALVCVVSLVIARVLLRYFLRYQRNNGSNTRNVVVLGAGDLGKSAIETIRQNSWVGYRILGFFDDDPKKQDSIISGVKVIGSLDDLRSYALTHRVDVVFIALPMGAEKRSKEIVDEMKDSTADILLVPNMRNMQMLSLSVTELAGLPIINVSSTPMNSPLNVVLKWIEDKVLAFFILVLISPVLVAVALGVKFTSQGPVLFKQRRYGLNGEEIWVYKFRSMSVCEDGGSIKQATRNDSRVTPFGAFLRSTSLDELPQFFNVLQGRMSIVGPRPHAVAHNEEYRKIVDSYMLRHKVKPGVTGWAQINGWRGETDTLEKMQKRVEFDLYYLSNWSLFLDLKIVFLTIFKGFMNSNAY